MKFKLESPFRPTGDQPKAIEKLTKGIRKGMKDQVLLGVTGSGKTFTMASVIEQLQLPTLVISPNKILAAQLYQEFKSFFPDNAVNYFVSYYDYYQPEAFLPVEQIYIQKDARINSEIDKLRHVAIQNVLTRKDVLVVASVSCIYGIGSPDNYQKARLELKIGRVISPQDLARHLNLLQYTRNDPEPEQARYGAGKLPTIGEFSFKINRIGTGRIFIHLVTDEKVELELERKKIKKITIIRNSSFEIKNSLDIYPAKFWVTPKDKFNLALRNIKSEMEERIEELQAANKFEEAERLERRTVVDLEMIKKYGYVNGIENYSRHFDFRQPGEPALTLLDYFPKPFLLVVDESHVTIPQLKAMQVGDLQRKSVLVDNGFRLPSAIDNRPLRFEEFESKTGQVIYVSATPSFYEMEKAINGQVVEQLVRPTGILDPEIVVRPARNQVKDLVKEIKIRIANNERVLALTLTKRSAEDLTEFLLVNGIRASFLHSEIKTLKRPEILASLRRGEVDVIVGVNLLREGLDLPEVGLVAILDADREGFLRNYRGIVQMAGRAARSINGKVILYADFLTESIKKAILETRRRRIIQKQFNKKIGAVPKALNKPIADELFAQNIK